jgi:hypothetical protein
MPSPQRQSSAPSGPPSVTRLVAALERLDEPGRPIAETYRRVAGVARELGLVRPSYEQVRTLVHRARDRGRSPSAGDVLLALAFNAKPPTAVIDYLVGTAPLGRVR